MWDMRGRERSEPRLLALEIEAELAIERGKGRERQRERERERETFLLSWDPLWREFSSLGLPSGRCPHPTLAGATLA
jgi:hypothetical protein